MKYLKVSWVMPVYNAEKYLKQAIDSILCQTYDNFEVIVIDDCSSDSSYDIVTAINDERLRVYRNNQNLGVTRSLNIGLSFASGEYIARMDSDDISLPDRLKMQVVVMDENPGIGICGCNTRIFGTSDRVIRHPLQNDQIKCYLLAGSPFAHPSVMIRKSVLDRYNLSYDNNFVRAQDYDLWVKLLQVCSAVNLDEVLLEYRIHDQQVSNLHLQDQDIYATMVRKRILELIGIDASDGELELHRKIFTGELIADETNLNWITEWLNRIISANCASRKLNSDALKEFLRYYWWSFMELCSSTGIDISTNVRKSLLKDSCYSILYKKIMSLLQ